MESEEITEVIRKRPQASVQVNSKVHGNPLNQSIIYKQRGGFSLKDKKNAKPDDAAGGEEGTSESAGRVVPVTNQARFRPSATKLTSCCRSCLLKLCSNNVHVKNGGMRRCSSLPDVHVSLFSLKRQSKPIITTGAGAKPQLF